MPAPTRSRCRRNPWGAGTAQACHGRRPWALPRPPRALRQKAVARDDDVVHFETEMMDPAARIAGKKIGDGRIVAQGRQQLDLAAGKFDEHRGDTMQGLGHRRGDLGAQHIAIDRYGFVEIGCGDRYMVELADHNSTTVTRVTGFLPQASCAARRAARRTASRSASLSVLLGL